ERLVLLLEACDLVPESVRTHVDMALVTFGDVETYAMVLAERIRDYCPELRLMVNCGGGSFKGQMKRADRSGAAMALIIGEDEMRDGKVTVKSLRDDQPQVTCTVDELVAEGGRLQALSGSQ
ncbi:MAG: His/Gly/Thr/Pro-type tRNA ligase C-terminal domain-containing protein, partial [Cytophagales bacterium]|nr:His/Gly/Thr/Pro-type tRNA ligase C-terminal domain-containing protein [Cytophagales bacterium]